MRRFFGRGRSRALLAAVGLTAGVLSTPAFGGHHEHGTKYRVVQGYIIQNQAVAPAACVPVAPPQAQACPAPMVSASPQGSPQYVSSPPPMPSPSVATPAP